MIPQPLPQSRLWLRSPPSEPETAQSRSVQVFDAQQWNPCPCRINRSGALHVVLASLMSNSTSAGSPQTRSLLLYRRFANMVAY